MDQDARAGSGVTVSPCRPSGERRQTDGVLDELRERSHTGDAVAIATVPAILVAIFLVVGAPDRSLVLSHAAPTGPSLVTAHFVHRSSTHLLENVAAYLLVVPTGYALAVLAGRRREFVVAFVGNLVLLPPVLSALGLFVFDHGVALGFSGVTMAFVGLVALQTGTYVEARLADRWNGDLAPALFFAGLAFVSVTTVTAYGPRVVLAGGAVAAAGFSLRGALDSLRPVRRSVEGIRSGAGQVGLLGLVVLLVGLIAGFPAAPDTGTVVVNRFGHFAGFVVGFLGPYLTFHVLGGRAGQGTTPPEAV